MFQSNNPWQYTQSIPNNQQTFVNSQIINQQAAFLQYQILKLNQYIYNCSQIAPTECQNVQEELVTTQSKTTRRQEGLARYKAKKRNWARKIIYQVRQNVADNRLRISGQFLSQTEQNTVLKVQQCLGGKTVQIKNKNVIVKRLQVSKLKSKDEIMKILYKCDPTAVVQRINQKKQLFYIQSH